MDPKKTQDVDQQETIKTTAVDTGRRVDVGGVHKRTPFVKRRPPTTYTREDVPNRIDSPAISTSDEIDESEPKVVAKPRARVDKQQHSLDTPEKITTLYVEPLEIDESGDFAAMLDESDDGAQGVSLKVGDKVTGKIVHIGKDHTFIAVGPKLEAAIDTIELKDNDGELSARLGQKISAYVISVTGGVTLSKQVTHAGIDSALLEEAAAKKVPVEGKVLSINKGGFDVQISGKRAFCPVGQIDNKYVEDPSVFVGRSLPFLIERIEESGRNIVVSRRALLERERKEKAFETLKDLSLNKRYDAVITRVADFGAFADIGGMEGLIPRSEISHGHIDRVSDIVSTGDRVEVVVLSFDIDEKNPTKSKLSFSLKKTKDDPYTLHWGKIKSGATLEGRVVRLESFGAFIELFAGIDGLIHISELSENRIQHPKEILSIGDPVTVRVVNVDDESKRIALSLREAVSKKKDKTSTSEHAKIERGQKTSGVVSRIERYGVFLELDSGATALLPQSEIDLPRTTDLHRAFSIGDKLDVVVIDVDAQNRVRVSLLARKQMEERDSFLKFQNEETARGASFGTFKDLLKKK